MTLRPYHFIGADVQPLPNDDGTIARNILHVVSQMKITPPEPPPVIKPSNTELWRAFAERYFSKDKK